MMDKVIDQQSFVTKYDIELDTIARKVRDDLPANFPKTKVNTYDLDGVVYMGPGRRGLRPEHGDFIITGRSYEEEAETYQYLNFRGITDTVVYFNPLPFAEKTRETSGEHKALTILSLIGMGYDVSIHFEDDPIQAEIIRQLTPVTVVLLVHDLVEKENARHDKDTLH